MKMRLGEGNLDVIHTIDNQKARHNNRVEEWNRVTRDKIRLHRRSISRADR